MASHSAGLLLYRAAADPGGFEVLLVHPGGPFWARKDAGAWSIPKGEYEAAEDPLAAARREFGEETGSPAPEGTEIDLGEAVQRGGKVVRAFALRGDLDAAAVVSNTFEMVWPPKSGQVREFPEVDRAEWFTAADAADKLNPAQAVFLDRLAETLG
ncbi:NUDIX domain-containing protein [Gordonia crocea]|nr:NUDIX domain-containing protein [Gordonia crocea]